MADIGKNQKLSIGSREFHIQTMTHVDRGIISSEIFEKGRLLYTEWEHYERRDLSEDKGAEARLRKEVEKFHQLIIEELESLFEISEKLKDEKRSGPHERLGFIFLYLRIFDKANEHFRHAIELDPARFSSSIYLARSYYFQKQYHQAYEVLKETMRQGCDYPDLYNLMGLVLLERRQLNAALKYFKEAIYRNPQYTEAYWNLAGALLHRIQSLSAEKKETEKQKSLEFLSLILQKIEKFGRVEDRTTAKNVLRSLSNSSLKKASEMIHHYREIAYLRRTPPEIIGYEFYLRLRYSDEEMSSDTLAFFEEKISRILDANPSFPDFWNYLALIHLMQCRLTFLEGLDNFRQATRINPNFEKARKNLRLVENDGREFLSLIKAII